MRDLSSLNINIQDNIYFTCPFCGRRSLISECSTIEQKDKTIRTDSKIVSGVMGKQYKQTTEVYTAYKVRHCNKCHKAFTRNRNIAVFLLLFFAPCFVGIMKHSMQAFFFTLFAGIVLFVIYLRTTWPKADIADAIRKNAIEKPNLF